MFEIFRDFFPKSDFTKSVVTLMTGTTISQILPLMITPILTRLYTPSDFGLLALYLSTTSLLSILVTGNYEKSIVMPKLDRSAIGLIKLSLFLIAIGCSLVMIFTFLLSDSISFFYENPAIKGLVYFIPFSVFSLAIYNVINTWFNRVKEYKLLSYNRITKSSISSTLTVILGFLRLESLGLIVSEFFGQLLATLLFGRSFYKINSGVFSSVTTKEVVQLSKEYRNFPQYTLPADMLSMASYQLPVFFFSKMFTSTIVGFYSLSIRVLDKPFSLLTSAIYEVFRQKAVEDYNAFGNCREIYKKTFISLLLIAMPSMTLFFILSPVLFKIIFGGEWETAGYYARIISVMYMFRFMASPLSFTFYVVGKQKLDFILHVYVFFSSLVIFSVSYFYSFTVINTLAIFVINYSCVYTFYLIKSYQFSYGKSA